jgi:hypothetical protein
MVKADEVVDGHFESSLFACFAHSGFGQRLARLGFARRQVVPWTGRLLAFAYEQVATVLGDQVAAADDDDGIWRGLMVGRQLGSTRTTVSTLSILRSNDAIVWTPVASALATRYASAKSMRSTS